MTERTLFSGLARIVAAVVIFAGALPAAAQIKVVAYNCLENPTTTSDSNWNQQLTNYGSSSWYNSYYGTGNYGTIPQRPTIMALTECGTSLQGQPNSAANVQTMLNNIYGSAGANYALAQIHAGSYEDYAFVYDTTKIKLLDTLTVDTGYRPAFRGHFQPVGYTSTNSDFYIYDCHLDAYSGDEQVRLSEVNAILFRAAGAANKLPADANIIYAGDFNFVTSGGEPGYDLLLNPNPGTSNPGVAFDPLTGKCNPAYGGSAPRAYSTYSSTSPRSRIDFQFPSTELGDGRGMDYIHSVNGLDSLHAYGNRNGSTSGCPSAQASSDHLALIADYQIPAKMAATVHTDGITSPVIVGATASVKVQVENVAPVIAVAGADKLDYSITGTGVVTGTASGTDWALNGGNTHAITLDTSMAGARSGLVQVNSTSPAVQDGSYNQSVNLVVLDHSKGSFASDSVANRMPLNVGNFAPSTGTQSSGFNIYNLMATAGYTAKLNVLSISGSGNTGILTTDAAATSIDAGSDKNFHAMLSTSLGQGLFNASYTISVSDENLPGATVGPDLVLDLTGYVAINGDLNLDRKVDSSDLSLLLSHYRQTSGANWGDGDINGDGMVDSADLSLLLSNYGKIVSDGLVGAQVPEPSSLTLVCVGGFILMHFRRWSRDRRR